MIDEKKLANAAMNDEELDKVAGGENVVEVVEAVGELLKKLSEDPNFKKIIDQKRSNQ